MIDGWLNEGLWILILATGFPLPCQWVTVSLDVSTIRETRNEEKREAGEPVMFRLISFSNSFSLLQRVWSMREGDVNSKHRVDLPQIHPLKGLSSIQSWGVVTTKFLLFCGTSSSLPTSALPSNNWYALCLSLIPYSGSIFIKEII